MRWTPLAVVLLFGVLILGTTAAGLAIARTLAASPAAGPGTLATLLPAQPSSPAPDGLTTTDGLPAPVVTVPALFQSTPVQPPPAPAPASASAPEPAPAPEPALPAEPAAAPPATAPVVPPYSTVLGWHGDQPVAYLTFDDGPAAATGAVLDILASAGATATFCMVGEKVAQNPGLARRVIDEGHTVCNHSWDHHSPFDGLPAAALDEQIGRTQDAIAGATGVRARYFRAPEGRFGGSGGAVLQACQRAGTIPLGWGVDSLDWKQPGVPALVAGVLGAVSPGAVILLHDGGGTDRQQTLEALPAVITGLRAAGYTLAALPADPIG